MVEETTALARAGSRTHATTASVTLVAAAGAEAVRATDSAVDTTVAAEVVVVDEKQGRKLGHRANLPCWPKTRIAARSTD